jgi:hypothetical protein
MCSFLLEANRFQITNLVFTSLPTHFPSVFDIDTNLYITCTKNYYSTSGGYPALNPITGTNITD